MPPPLPCLAPAAAARLLRCHRSHASACSFRAWPRSLSAARASSVCSPRAPPMPRPLQQQQCQHRQPPVMERCFTRGCARLHVLWRAAATARHRQRRPQPARPRPLLRKCWHRRTHYLTWPCAPSPLRRRRCRFLRVLPRPLRPPRHRQRLPGSPLWTSSPTEFSSAGMLSCRRTPSSSPASSPPHLGPCSPTCVKR